MKNKFLIFFIAIITVSNFAFAQSKPLSKQELAQSVEYAASDHVMLIYKNKEIQIFGIKLSNIVSLLGKPKQIKKEKSEIDEQIHATYIYESGDVDFDAKGNLYGLEIKKQGWALVLKVDDKITKPFNIGVSLNDLRNAFPRYFAKIKSFKNEDMYAIKLITKNKIPVESDILFGVKDGHVIYMSYAEDDS